MIKTRFAPSPTGYLHVGGLRTALYCYLFAKSSGGKFVLRIEDTDQKRLVEDALDNLLKTMDWIGLNYDEGPNKGDHGPYVQSERTQIYKDHVQKLLDSGHAYHCFCSSERLDEMRERQMANKQGTMYDRHCADLPESEVNSKIEAGEPFVIRQKIPYEQIKFKDLIRGNMQFDGKTVDDQVLVKSDGFPTYHLANVVDDHLMEITHVIRGEEWLPSTPKHVALYHAFGWDAPDFAHIPLLLNADGKKLSKREADVSVESYIQKGYSREAIINFIAFLGWHPGGGDEKEIYTLEELEKVFSLEKVHKAGAIFNIEKLDWFNWRWLKEGHLKKLEEAAKNIDSNVEIAEPRPGQLKYIFAKQEDEDNFQAQRGTLIYKICKMDREPDEKLYKALVTVEEKALKAPSETESNIEFYYELPDYDKELLTHEKMRVDYTQAKESLSEGIKDLQDLEDWSLSSLEKTLLATVERMGVKNGQLLWPLRSALSGLSFSPGVFELAWVLGKEESLNRLKKAHELL